MSRESNSDIKQKILALESIFGQKETARRLGVSPSTLKNYKTGKTKPNLLKQKKINRVHGQNRKKIVPEKLEKKLEREKQRGEKKAKNPPITSTAKFIKNKTDEKFVQVNVMKLAPEFIASNNGRVGQFLNANEAMEKKVGFPKGTKFIYVIGTYTSNYEMKQEDQSEVIRKKIPVQLGAVRKGDVDYQTAIEYAEKKFHSALEQQGKRRMNPLEFIGFSLH